MNLNHWLSTVNNQSYGSFQSALWYPTGMAIADDIKRAREAKGLSQAALAAQVGISQPAIRKIESGQTANSRWLPRIYAVLGLAFDATDRAVRQLVSEPSLKPTVPIDKQIYPSLDGRLIPIFGRELSDNKNTGDCKTETLYSPKPTMLVAKPWYLRDSENCFGLFIENEFMSPIYELEDIIICNPELTIVRNCNVIIGRYSEQSGLLSSVYRLIDWTTDTWRVRAFNPFQEFDMPKNVAGFIARIAGKAEA